MISRNYSLKLGVLALALCVVPPAFAQDDEDEAIEEIVVTGTGATVLRTEFETPQSVTQ